MSKFHYSGRSKHWPSIVRKTIFACLCTVVLAGCGESATDMLSSAKGYLAKNEINAATIQLKNALLKDGNLAEARFLMGKINLEQRDVLGAVKELQRAESLGYPENEVIPLLAKALVLNGQHEDVLNKYLQKTLSNASSQSMLLDAIGDAYMVKADPVKAEQFYTQALQADGANTIARLGLARAMLFNGEKDKALTETLEEIKTHPDNSDAYDLLTDIYLSLELPDDAIRALGEALRIRQDPVYYYRLIGLLLSQDKMKEAEERLAEMKKIAPKHANTIYLQALVDFRENRLKESQKDVMEVLQLVPDSLQAHLLAGAVFARQKEYLTARTHLGKVLEQLPGHLIARRLMIATYLGTNEPIAALDMLKPLLREERESQDPKLFNLAGRVFLANGDIAQAEAYFTKAVEVAPQDAQLRTQLGMAKFAGGDTAGAFADLEMASGLDEASSQADLARVLLYIRQGETDKAMEAQKELERRQPNDPQTFNLKGAILITKKEYPEARAAFETALSLKPGFLPAVNNLALLDMNDKRPEVAKKRYEDLIALTPDNADAYLALANFQAKTGATPAEVQTTLERAVTAAPSMFSARAMLVQLYLTTKQPEKALKTAQEGASSGPSDPQMQLLLGQTLLAAGDVRQALNTLTNTVTLAPDSVPALLGLADAQIKSELPSEAEQTLRRVLTLKPDELNAQLRLINMHVAQKAFHAASLVTKTIQRQRPKEPIGYKLEGDIDQAENKLEAAAAAYRKAMQATTQPTSAEVPIQLYSVLMALKKTADANKVVQEWFKAFPKDLELRLYLGQMALIEKRYRDAVNLFDELNKLAPDTGAILNNLAWAGAQIKDPKALSYAERAVQLEPENPAYLDTLGSIQTEKGQVDEAIKNLQKAISLAAEAPLLRLNLAKAYLKAGRRDEARHELDEIIPKLPKDSPLLSEASSLRQPL